MGKQGPGRSCGMIDTLEQFEQAEEAIAKMKQFLLVVRYTYTPEAYRALSAPILRESSTTRFAGGLRMPP
jgi:hypothetical protein